MVRWLYTHIAVLLAFGSPAALILFSAFMAWLPDKLVNPPKYDLLFITNYNDFISNTLRVEVRDMHAYFSFVGENFNNDWPHLYRFSPASGKIVRLPIPIPPSLRPVGPYNRPAEENETVVDISVPAVEKLQINPSNVAPDGYEFIAGYTETQWLMNELFLSSPTAHKATIAKNGYIIEIPDKDGGKDYVSPKFVGWIVP